MSNSVWLLDTEKTTTIPVLDAAGFEMSVVGVPVERNQPFKDGIQSLLTDHHSRVFIHYLAEKKFITAEEIQFINKQLSRAVYEHALVELTEYLNENLISFTKYCHGTNAEILVMWWLFHSICKSVNMNFEAIVRTSNWDETSYDQIGEWVAKINDHTLPSGTVCFEDPTVIVWPYTTTPGEFVLYGGSDYRYRIAGSKNNTSAWYTPGVFLTKADNDYIIECSRLSLVKQFKKEYGDDIPYPTTLAAMEERNILYVGESVISTSDIKAVIVKGNNININYALGGYATLTTDKPTGRRFIVEYLVSRIVK